MYLVDKKNNITFFLNLLLGVGLASLVMTKLRFASLVGFGEAVLMLFCLVGLTTFILKREISLSNLFTAYSELIFIYFIIILIPVTFINFSNGTFGTNLRDIAAYFICFTFLLYLSNYKINVTQVSNSFIITFVIIELLIIFLFPELGKYVNEQDPVTQSLFINRFTGGAKNPNQLAFYVICALFILQKTSFSKITKAIIFVILILIGGLTLSDAYFLSIASLIFLFLISKLNPPKYIKLSLTLFVFFLSMIYALFFNQIFNTIYDLYSYSNNGSPDSVRLFLYFEGISLWLSNIFILLFGNGAGAFIELTSNHTLEAHNTFIDALIIFGLVGSLLFFIIPLIALFKYYFSLNYLMFAIASAVFIYCFFHYTARQPMFWFIIFLMINDFFPGNYSLKTNIKGS